MHSDVCQNLTININLCLGQAIDQSTVAHTALTRGSIDARNPQRAELALALATIAISILAGFHYCLVGGLESTASRAAVTLGFL